MTTINKNDLFASFGLEAQHRGRQSSYENQRIVERKAALSRPKVNGVRGFVVSPEELYGNKEGVAVTKQTLLNTVKQFCTNHPEWVNQGFAKNGSILVVHKR